MKKTILLIYLLIFTIYAWGQFHTMKMPTKSPKVSETQRLGITDITIDYHSPAVRDRDIWQKVVPFEGEPIPWRAGANMNTTIAFSTDVKIEENALKAGSYGLHVIPKNEGKWEILFANNDNLWGSYYLDLEKDIVLKVMVTPEETNFSEQLDFEFMNRKEDVVTVALEWGNKRIPFLVSVDLNKTVVDNFRYELRGINTYQWEAWNDAATWCLDRNIYLEEALSWAERSINGGYNGFASNKNLTNLATKANILWALNRKTESDATYNEFITMMNDPNTAYRVSMDLQKRGREAMSLSILEEASKRFKGQWYVHLGYGKMLYENGNPKKAVKELATALDQSPEQYKDYLEELLDKMKNGEPMGS
ncbi:MAG: DUF2911 domain-containing protein [Bacteroidota bacterium]